MAHTRGFLDRDGGVTLIEDSMAERPEFELPVPVLKLPDDSFW
jgi:hypothetical protein